MGLFGKLKARRAFVSQTGVRIPAPPFLAL